MTSSTTAPTVLTGSLASINSTTLSASDKPPVLVQVSPFIVERVTPLDEGSNNDGSGTHISMAMLVDNTYLFVVKPRNDSSGLSDFGWGSTPGPQWEDARWEVIYTSLAPSSSKQPITRKCKPQDGKGNKVKGIQANLCLLAQFDDDALDMCGAGTVMTGANKMSTGIIVRAYLSSTVYADSEPVPVHCRFRWFDAKRVKEQAHNRKSKPWRINQGQSGLCGMAAVYTAMILRGGSERQPGPHAKNYQNLATELHRKGIYTPTCRNPYTIRPQADMYDVNPMKDQDFHALEMREVDYITLAGTESSHNKNYKGLTYNGFYVTEATLPLPLEIIQDGLGVTIANEISTINTGAYPPRVIEMLTRVAGFSSTVDHTPKVYPPPDLDPYRNYIRFSVSSDKIESLLKMLQTVDDLYKSGKGQFPLLIDGWMMLGTSIKHDKYGNIYDATANHWALYAGNLTLPTLENSEMVSFEVFTWGTIPGTGGKNYPIPQDIQSYFKEQNEDPVDPGYVNEKPGISKLCFGFDFFGYIEANN